VTEREVYLLRAALRQIEAGVPHAWAAAALLAKCESARGAHAQAVLAEEAYSVRRLDVAQQHASAAREQIAALLEGVPA
jgi:hypothetical protein